MKLDRRRSPAGRARSRGQALVEFALVVPLFLLLLAGAIDFGMGLHHYMVIINAARDGARLGATACGSATAPCSGTISARVTTSSDPLNPDITVKCATAAAPATATTPICDSGAAKEGGSITVTATYTYRMVWPLAFGNQIVMTSSAKFMVQ